jgi:hypothetical protein
VKKYKKRKANRHLKRNILSININIIHKFLTFDPSYFKKKNLEFVINVRKYLNYKQFQFIQLFLLILLLYDMI